MRAAEPKPSPFRAEIERAGDGVVLVTWQGHMSASVLADHCNALDVSVKDLGAFVLVIDATGVSGYDHAARTWARCWATGPTAGKARAVAIIADSQLAAAESPAAAMAPPRKARLFGSRRAAMAFVETAAFATSGEYDVVDRPSQPPR